MARGWRRRVGPDALVAGVVGVGAVAMGPQPTGAPLPDLLLAFTSGCAVSLAGARASRWAWLLLAGTAAGLADGPLAIALALAALAVALWSAVAHRANRLAGAAAAGGAFLALLAGTVIDVHGVPTIVTAAALLPLATSAYGHASGAERRMVRAALFCAFAYTAAAGIAAAVAASGARPSVEAGIAQLDRSLGLASEGRSDRTARELERAGRSFSSAHRKLDAWWARPALAVPVLGQNLRATTSVTHQAGNLADVAAEGARRADVDSLRMRQGSVDLGTVRELEEPLERVADQVGEARRTIGEIDSPWLLGPVDSRLTAVRTDIHRAERDSRLAVDAVRLAPPLLGGEGPRRYLVLFVTPVEARGRFGFPGNYAELTFDDGRLDMTDFGRITELNAGLRPGARPQAERTIDGPAEYLARYGRFEPNASWQNITMAPDLPSIASVAAQLYPQSGGREIDGLVVVDPFGLAEIMRDTGPVRVEGIERPIDADAAAQFLLEDQYLELADQDRKDALETLARTTFDRLSTVSLPGPRRLGDRFGPLVRGGHLVFTSIHQEEADLLERLGLDGSVAGGAGDHLMVTSSNASGNKIDLFLRRQIRYDATWDPRSGQVRSHAVVTLTNTAPSSGLPDYVIANAVGQSALSGEDLPPGTNRLYLSVYSPFPVDRATLDGRSVEVESQPEVGLLAHSLFVTLPPGSTAVLDLELRGTLDPAEPYSLTVEAGHVIEPDSAEVGVTVADVDHRKAPLRADDGHVEETLLLDRRRRVELHTG